MQSSPLQRFSHASGLLLWFLAVTLTSVVLHRGFTPSDYLLVGTALVWLFGFRFMPVRLHVAPICVAVWVAYCFVGLAWLPVLDLASAREKFRQ